MAVEAGVDTLAAVAVAMVDRAAMVVEDTSRAVEEDTVDRVVTVVVVDTSRADTVVDTEHCCAAALASSACWV